MSRQGRRQTDQDLSDLRHRVDNHDTVLSDIRKGLHDLVAEFSKLKNYALVVGVTAFGGSDTGRDLLSSLLS